jgi:cell division septation protein DedD
VIPSNPTRPGTNPVLGAGKTAGCPSYAPYGKVYERAGAPGTILVCGTEPPNFTGVHPDRHGALGRTNQAGQVAQALHASDTPINYAPQFTDQAIAIRPPKGYKQAWNDDRLNPNRARGTIGGHQQMQQVWTTDEVPQRGVNEPRKRRWYEKAAAPAPQQQATATYSAKGTPKAVTGGRLVQVGSFGVPENAARAAKRLQALGLPVQMGRATIKGKPVQVVSAGPFASAEQANAALVAARRAGFADAILRR